MSFYEAVGATVAAAFFIWLLSKIPGFFGRRIAKRRAEQAAFTSWGVRLRSRETTFGELAGLPVDAQALLIKLYKNGPNGMYIAADTPGLAVLEECKIVRAEFLEKSGLAGERKYVIWINPEIVFDWLANSKDVQWR